MIKAMKFASIPVKDQQRALDFYTRKLGFHVTTDQAMGPGHRWIELGLNGGSAVVLFTPPGHEDRIGTFSGISFVCDDVEKTHTELAKRGVEFTLVPKKESWAHQRSSRTSTGTRSCCRPGKSGNKGIELGKPWTALSLWVRQEREGLAYPGPATT